MPSILKRYRAFLIDIDGVLVRGSQPIARSAEALTQLQQAAHTVLLSNNSTRSRADLAEYLQSIGFSVSPDNALVSGSIAAAYLFKLDGPTTVWCIGETGLRKELESAGHRLAQTPADAAWVVAGLHRSITYDDLTDALHAFQAGARFLATNDDASFPTERGLIPGAGAIIGALAGMGYAPSVVVGKPSPIAFDVALSHLGLPAGDVLMIGDRLDTDIVGGCNAGLETALLLSGVTTRSVLDSSDASPTWIADDLHALVRGQAMRNA